MTALSRPTFAALIHAAGIRLVLAITGGGSRAIADLLEVPGGSGTLLAAHVPYSAAAMRELLGGPPERYCSNRTARAMAMAAYLQAQALTASEAEIAQPAATDGGSAIGRLTGVACTASLASDRPKRGPHRIHVAWQTAATTATYSVELVKGRRSRPEEEGLAATLILNALADAACLSERLPAATKEDEPIATTRTDAPPAFQALLGGAVQAVRQTGSELTALAGSIPPSGAGRRALFPGAFNPLHEGHRRMAEVAAETLTLPVEFEISIENVDKPPLDFFEMSERSRQFAGVGASAKNTIWLTRAPTFDAKAALFPNTTFIVGVDTIRRVADLRYYAGDSGLATAAIERIAASGGRFLVFGRAAEGKFQSLASCPLPDCLLRISAEVPGEQFRNDISSTALRRLQEK